MSSSSSTFYSNVAFDLAYIYRCHGSDPLLLWNTKSSELYSKQGAWLSSAFVPVNAVVYTSNHPFAHMGRIKHQSIELTSFGKACDVSSSRPVLPLLSLAEEMEPKTQYGCLQEVYGVSKIVRGFVRTS